MNAAIQQSNLAKHILITRINFTFCLFVKLSKKNVDVTKLTEDLLDMYRNLMQVVVEPGFLSKCPKENLPNLDYYEVRLLGIDDASQQDSPVYEQHRFSEGDRVWVRHPSRRCDSPSTEGTVTRVVSAQNVEVDGMPRHVRDLRLSTSLPRDCPTVEERLDTDAQEDLQIRVRIPTNDLWEEEDEGEEEEEMDSPGRQLPRRSSRERRPVRPFQYCDL
ncbi:hypothetical protein Pcinc_016429 [Petrolisthes cinctipes]|uniref:Uncharacterized protein n=1 Tax=Petrolisthes cinctipes TaxID=88211 RepID=A0AAE1FRE2_PETCI|nr:hypothetical protein Pcinc_016429 [Petrolisthes cinctipes]